MRKLFFAALLCAAAPAMAKDEEPCGKDLVCASSPTSVAAEMMRSGYQALVTKDKLGDPTIESAASGYNFQVYFYGCEKNAACDSVQFAALFKNEDGWDAKFANDWNRTKRFSQMAIQEDGGIMLSHDVSTIGGLTRKNFADELLWWSTMLGEADRFFAERRKPAPAAPAK